MSSSGFRPSLPGRLMSRYGAWMSLGVAPLAMVALAGVLSSAQTPPGNSLSPGDSESAQVKAGKRVKGTQGSGNAQPDLGSISENIRSARLAWEGSLDRGMVLGVLAVFIGLAVLQVFGAKTHRVGSCSQYEVTVDYPSVAHAGMSGTVHDRIKGGQQGTAHGTVLPGGLGTAATPPRFRARAVFNRRSRSGQHSPGQQTAPLMQILLCSSVVSSSCG